MAWTELQSDLFWLVREYATCLWNIEHELDFDYATRRVEVHREIEELLSCSPGASYGVLHNFPRTDDGKGYHSWKATNLLLDFKKKGLLNP